MPTILHSNLTGAEQHEPLGVDGASANTVYVGDGAGSGTWQKISTAEVDTSFKNTNKVVLNINITDLSTAESHYVVSPIAGDIEELYSVRDKAIATADTTIAAKIATVSVTGGLLTLAYSGSAAGDVDQATPSGANTVTAGQTIEFVCGGETNTSGAHAHLSILMDVS